MAEKQRALVVDDDRSWMAIIREILEDSELVVDSADDLHKALAMLEKPHRLAVIDLSLNERDHHNQEGLKILQELHRRDPRCAALLLTGYATVELAVNAIKQYGAYDVMRKEVFNRADFRKMVANVLSANPPPMVMAPAKTAMEARNADLKENEAQHATILVVEDDISWQDILTELLNDSGYAVRTCSSFGEALGCLRRERYQLAIMDLNLSRHTPGNISGRSRPESLEGYRLLAGMQGAGTPVIILSGLTDPGLIEQAFTQQHVFAFIEKQTFNRRVFIQTIREALEHGNSNPELEILTVREREVLELLAKGMTNKEIADTLVITTNTVKRHLKSVFAKLNIHTRSAAVAKIKSEKSIA